MIRMLASIRGVGIETAEMLVQEVLSRNLRDRKAVARYAGLPVRRMRARPSDAKKVSPNRAMPGWPLTIRGGGDPSRNMVIEPFV
jgi:hypothetical protein